MIMVLCESVVQRILLGTSVVGWMDPFWKVMSAWFFHLRHGFCVRGFVCDAGLCSSHVAPQESSA
jgi:hypothetical protein